MAPADADGSITEARPPGSRKVSSVVPANLVFDSQPFVKIDQVGAAAEQHMLAIVHDLTGARMLI